jgi:hypothetical protein
MILPFIHHFHSSISIILHFFLKNCLLVKYCHNIEYNSKMKDFSLNDIFASVSIRSPMQSVNSFGDATIQKSFYLDLQTTSSRDIQLNLIHILSFLKRILRLPVINSPCTLIVCSLLCRVCASYEKI